MLYCNQTRTERLKELILTTFFSRIPTILGIKLRSLVYQSLFKRMGNSVYIQEDTNFFGTCSIEIGEIVHILKGVNIDARGMNNHIYIKNGVVLYEGVNIKALDATNIYIGEHTLISNNVCIIGQENIKIGRDCFIGDYSGIFTSHHVFSDMNMNTIYNSVIKQGIVIEDDCWFGHGVTVLNGVTIGKGSVICPNSIVTEDIPPYSKVAGIPAKVIESRQKYQDKFSEN